MILAGVAPGLRAIACEMMELLGTSYQVQDDLADLYGLKGREEVASDLRNGRLSAPVVHFLSVASEDERSRFVRFCGSSDQTAEANYWLRRLRRSAAIEATIDHARGLCQRSRTGLAELPPALAAVLDTAASRMSESLSQLEMAFSRSRVWSAAPMANVDPMGLLCR
jgi:geranylgeranyl pyrophosphate synthase